VHVLGLASNEALVHLYGRASCAEHGRVGFLQDKAQTLKDEPCGFLSDEGRYGRAKALSSEERSRIAREAVEKRWERAGKLRPASERGVLRAAHTGSFKDEFGIDVDCYVLNDERKTAVISQRGMAEALGMGKSGGSRLPSFLQGKTISRYVGHELKEKLSKPLVFQATPPGTGTLSATVHGFDVTILIDLCKAIMAAEADGSLLRSQSPCCQASPRYR
jgi:hypothetical protein